MNKIIFFELNEVPQKIVDYFIMSCPNSWLAKNYTLLKKFNTFTENPGQLNPWNTWPTVHRGIDSSRHGILDLNQNLTEQDKDFPAIWQRLTENNIKTGIFGSLHTYQPLMRTNSYAFYIPDVFAQSPTCWPEKVEAFQRINLELSRKSARNVNRHVPKKALLNLALKSPTLGIKPQTISKIAHQLFDERRASWKSTRRRTMQALISFDIFFKLLRQKKPDFVTFYTNHVAASLHRYWAATFPTAFEVNHFPKDWIERYDGEIIYTLTEMDKMLAKLAQFVNRNPAYKLIILSSMGQDAVKAKPIYTQLYITNPTQFMTQMGVGDHFKSVPAMLPQFNFTIDPLRYKTFELNANQTTINGKPLRFRSQNTNHISIEMGHINQTEIVLKIGEEVIKPNDSGLENVPISDHSSTTANHIPEGIFYTYHPSYQKSVRNETMIETCSIYPTLLKNFGLNPPDYATRGNNLIL